MSQKKLISIAMAEPQIFVRESIAALIDSFGGFRVTLTAADGVELIEKIERSETLPDICLVEINMPRLNGYQTVQTLKQRWPMVQVIALTEYDSDESVVNMASRGADMFISKHSDGQKLKAILLEFTTGIAHQLDEIALRIPVLIQQSSYNDLLLTDDQLEFLTLYCSIKERSDVASETGRALTELQRCERELLKKFKIRQRAALVTRAWQMGLFPFCKRPLNPLFTIQGR